MIYCFRQRSNDRFHNWKKGELSLTEKKNTSGVLKVLGVLMILFGVIYALLGTLALMGTLTGMLPGHEKQEVILVGAVQPDLRHRLLRGRSRRGKNHGHHPDARRPRFAGLCADLRRQLQPF